MEFSARAEESDHIDPDMREHLAASGLTDLVVPASHGGRFESVDSLAVTVLREALAAESGHLDSLFAMWGMGSYALGRGGSDQLRDAWLPRVATLDAIAGLALTEPEIGSTCATSPRRSLPTGATSSSAATSPSSGSSRSTATRASSTARTGR